MRLKLTSFGQSAEGIQLTGNPKPGEPDHVRIAFPGGDVEVVRALDGKLTDYWVHIRVNRPNDGHHAYDEEDSAKISNARLDLLDKNSSEVALGDFNNPQLYHVAVLVTRDSQEERLREWRKALA